MRSLLFDLRYGARALVKAPAFTIVTILTLALGIGANSAIFTLVNAALVRPLGFADPERLMLVYESIPPSGVERFDVSPADYLDMVQYQHSFSNLGAYRTVTVELSGGGEPEQIDAAEITSSLFDVLGVKPAEGRHVPRGRGPGPVERRDHQPRAVDAPLRRTLGDRIGDRHRPPAGHGGRRDARRVRVSAPRRLVERHAGRRLDAARLHAGRAARRAAQMYRHSVIGRLRDGTPPAQAVADVSALARRIRDNYPAGLGDALQVTVGAIPLTEELSGQVRRPLLILFGAVGLVLLVTCANVANLILSRSVARQRDIGVRAALGAGRLRLFQVLLSEALILATLGGALGLVFGYWSLRTIPAILTTSLPGISTISLDWRVIAFTSVLALGSAALFALVPLAAGLRRDLHDLLREGSTRATGGRRQHRVQGTLVVTSVALAFILLVCAGLFVRSFRNLVTVASGVGTTNVLSAKVRLPLTGYSEATRTRWFYRTLEERLRALPGVRAASIASDLPLDADGERRAATVENPTGPGVKQALAVTWMQGIFSARTEFR